MAYTVVPTLNTGDLETAAWANTYIKDNFAASEVGIVTAAGDLVYASAANALAVLPIGATGQWVRSTGSAIQWITPNDAMPVDEPAGTGSYRTLGTGALQAAVGSHTTH